MIRVALADTLATGQELSSAYDLVYVLHETFSDFENLKSVPNALDGYEPGVRDAFLEKLGDIVDLAALNSELRGAVKGLGVDAIDLVAVFEMNLYANYPEVWDLAKASWLLDQISGLQNLNLDSHLRDSVALHRFLGDTLSGVSFRIRTSLLHQVLLTVRSRLDLISNFLKGQAWLIVLFTRALLSPRFSLSFSSGCSLVLCPVTPGIQEQDGGFGPYWMHMDSLRQNFSRPAVPVFFSEGAFFEGHKRRRVTSRFMLLSWYLRTQLAICTLLVVQAKRVVLRAIGLSRRVTPKKSLEAALSRSLFGPAFSQSFWEQFQFRWLFGHVKPHAVLYLCEDQSWERALVVQGRRQSPQTKYLGVVHNAIRPWDLRYFKPQGWQLGPLSGKKSAPDYLLVTSEFCKARLNNAYAKSDQLRLVETLRFGVRVSQHHHGKREVVVVAGSYSSESNAHLLRFVEENMARDECLPPIRVRSHPMKHMPSRFEAFNQDAEVPILTICDPTSTMPVELTEMDSAFVVARFGRMPNMSPLADLPSVRGNFLAATGPSLGTLEISKLKSIGPRKFEYYERSSNWDLWRSLIQELDL